MGGDFIKLYKYRSIVDKTSFANYLKALDEGYLWFADIKSLNDPSDSMVYYDREKEEELFIEYFSNNQATIYRSFLKLVYQKIPQMVSFVDSITDEQILSMAEMMNNGNFNEFLLGVGASDGDIEKFEKAKKYSETNFKENEDKFKDILEPIFEFNDTYRHTIKVFSMSDSAVNKHLWEKYADEYGFCVEYETNLITDEMIELKDLNPVVYTDERDHFSWLPIFLAALQLGNQKKIKQNLEKDLSIQLLTKNTVWSKEREYRFFNNKANKIYANIVSGIILHKNILDTDEANRLIQLSKKEKWNLLVWDGNKLVLKFESGDN